MISTVWVVNWCRVAFRSHLLIAQFVTLFETVVMYVGIYVTYVIFDLQLIYEGLALVSHCFNCYKAFSFPVQVYEADAYRIKTGWRKTKVVVKVSSFFSYPYPDFEPRHIN